LVALGYVVVLRQAIVTGVVCVFRVGRSLQLREGGTNVLHPEVLAVLVAEVAVYDGPDRLGASEPLMRVPDLDRQRRSLTDRPDRLGVTALTRVPDLELRLELGLVTDSLEPVLPEADTNFCPEADLLRDLPVLLALETDNLEKSSPEADLLLDLSALLSLRVMKLIVGSERTVLLVLSSRKC